MNKDYRLRELVKTTTGHSLVIDTSGGLVLGALPGLEDFSKAVNPLLPYSDGVVASPGQARRLSARTHKDAALLVRADWTNALRGADFSLPPEKIHYLDLLDPAEALDLGVNGMVIHFLLGYEEALEAQCLHRVVQLALTGTSVGIPLIVEVLPTGPRVVLMSKAIELGVSYALEGGADGIVIPWPGKASLENILTMAAGAPVWLKPASLDPHSADLNVVLALGTIGLWLDERVFAAQDPTGLVKVFNNLLHAPQVEFGGAG